MAQPPLTWLERKWGSVYQGNLMVESATQSADRKQIPLLDYDTTRNISIQGRRTLLSMGRFLYANCSFIRGAIDEMVRLALSSFEPQFMGRDKEWGKVAKAWMEGNDRFIDIRGAQFSMDVDRRLIGLGALVDGEIGIVLTRDEQDNGRIQLIPSHRIGSRLAEATVNGGPYDGARIVDGVICDDYGGAMAYRVYGENYLNMSNYVDVSVNDMILAFIPDYPDQLRGFSRLGYSFFECEDVREARLFDLIAGKIAASYAIVEHTETGTADKTKKVFAAGATAADSASGAAQSLPQKLVQPGTILTVKAGSGQKIEIPNSDRPSVNMMEFQSEIISSVLNGQGWSSAMANGAELNGGALRVCVEKANAKCEEIQTMLVGPVISRVNSFRLAKAIKNKRIPANDEALVLLGSNAPSWRYHGPAEITPDKKYDSQVAISEMAAGINSPQRVCAKNNAVFEEVAQECADAAKMLQDAMEKAGVEILIGSAQVDKTPPQPEGDAQETPPPKKKGSK